MLLYVYRPYGFYFDPTYFLVLIGLALSLWAQFMVNSRFSRYSKVRSMSNMTGAQAAEKILYAQGIYDVSIEHVESLAIIMIREIRY